MRYFSFNGSSCASILGEDEPLILVSFDDGVDEIPGSSKEVISGSTSIYKVVANEYGNKYSDVLTFEYGLMKASGEMITAQEQEVIETWLTSPKLSQYLQLFEVECDSNGGFVLENSTPVAIYCGTFIETSWMPYEEGYMGVGFTFQCDQPYAWQFHDVELTDLAGDTTETITIETDALEDYVYPKIKLEAVNSETPTENIEIEITNETDNNNYLNLTTLSHLEINMDCRALMVTDNAGNIISYDDLGWADIGNIYWMRFKSGANILSFSIPANVTLNISMSYMSPKKIVGGWL